MFHPLIHLSRKIQYEFTVTKCMFYILLCLCFSIEYEVIEACYSFIDSHKSIYDTKKKSKTSRTIHSERAKFLICDESLGLARFFSRALVPKARFARFQVRMSTNEFYHSAEHGYSTYVLYIKHFKSCSFYNIITHIGCPKVKLRVLF